MVRRMEFTKEMIDKAVEKMCFRQQWRILTGL